MFFGSKMDPAQRYFEKRKRLFFEHKIKFVSGPARASILMTFGLIVGCFFDDFWKLKTALAKGSRK